MTAQQAYKEYGFSSMKSSGNKITLKNSDGKTVSVGKNIKVYHRGHGRFGLYSAARDAKRYSKGARTFNPVGTGPYRHTSDRGDGKRKR